MLIKRGLIQLKNLTWNEFIETKVFASVDTWPYSPRGTLKQPQHDEPDPSESTGKIVEMQNQEFNEARARMRREIRLAEVRCSGPRDENGTPIGGEFVFMVTLDLRLTRMLSSAGPQMLRPWDLSKVKVEKIESYSAPGYELMLFHKASELANKYDLALADALHLLYAQGQAEFIITDDVRTFVKRWEENPQFERESGVKVWTSKRMLERAKRLGWL